MDPYRLPRTVVPTRYDLRLVPDIPAASFTGEATVAVTVGEPVDVFVLNAAELRIDRAELTLQSGEKLQAAVALDAQEERCRLSFGRSVPAGNHRLFLSFAGTLNDKLRGFYRSNYKAAGGETRWLAATQFEATDARRAFPCWDEPSFRAVFSTTLVIDPALTAISNTSFSETHESNRKVVRFTDTMSMSTYLVAFVVGELEATDPVPAGSTNLRVWCVPGRRHLTDFGRDIGAFSLAFFEEYFDCKYPGDKLDLLAIPDFAAGAMENFGAITFRETALLVDPAAATLAEQERVADVVAHENAHMWFGDLVTMEWWNGLWLKEAFATFMEMLAVDAWKPQWKRWDTFGVSRSAALFVDGLHSTRPVEFTVRAPRDAEAMYDVLTYEKGCSVLRMLEQYLGPDVFRAGVRLYLQRHAYKNTQTEDLWNALGEASRQPIPAVMDGWIFQPGYPLLSADRAGNQLVLRQQRYPSWPPVQGPRPPADLAEVGPQGRPLSPKAARQEPPPPVQRWQVPVQVRLMAGGATRVERLLLGDVEARLPLPPGFQAALVNEGGHGFYRVRYAPALLEALLYQLPGGLSPIERFNLVNDCWASVLAGLMPLTGYLELTAHFRNERDKNVWSVIAGSFQTLNRIVEDEDRPRLAALVRDRAGPAVAELGWSTRSGDDDLIQQLRGDLLRLVGTLGEDAPTQAKAAEVYAAASATAGAVPASVIAAVVAILAHAGDEARYAEFLSRFRSARTPQEEQRYLYALAGFRRASLVEQTLTRTLNGEIRTQDAPFIVRTLLSSVHSRGRAWAFLRENWDRMSREYPAPGFRRMGEGVTGLATPEWEREVHAFFRERQVNLGGKVLQQYLEQLRIVVSLRQREGSALHQYLAGK